MGRSCELCDKKVSSGRMYTTRGLPKYKGGIGLKTTGVTLRKFKPNIQNVKAFIAGRVKYIWACTSCIRSGRVVRPPATAGSKKA